MRAVYMLLLFAVATPLLATEAKVVGDQLILSGRASGNELVLVRDAIAEHGDRIRVVILRDHSGRTENSDLMRTAELINERGWRTAISGFCGTACAYLFLGGVERHFTDDKSPGQTSVMFGSTNLVGDSRGRPNYNNYQADPSASGNFKFRQWIKSRTGGRMSESTLDRLFLPDAGIRYLHFYDAKRLARKDGASVLYCDGKEAPAKRWAECEKIADLDAYKEGIVTSAELVRANDRSPPAPGGSAATPPGPAK